MSNYDLAVTGLSGLSVPEKIERAGLFVKKLDGNKDFTNPDPALPTVRDQIAGLSTAWQAAQKGSEDDTRHLHQAEADFDYTMNLLWGYVQHTSKGDAEKILSTGMDVKGRTNGRPTPPVAPTDLTADYGTNEGEVELAFRCASTGNRSFRVRYRAVGVPNWTEWRESFFTRKVLLTGLPSGSRHEFQVRTENSAGVSPWSNTVTLMVP